MKTSNFPLFFLLGFLTVFSAAQCWAGTIQGEVTDVSSSATAFSVKRMDAPDKAETSFVTTEATELEGLDSIADLTAGDEVIVDASDEPNEVGKFEAHAVRISKVKIHEPVTRS